MDNYCLITGGASGLGEAFAKIFLEDGYNLLLVDKDLESLERVKAGLEQTGKGNVLIFHQDLSTEESADNVYSYTKELGIDVSVLINNAGFGIFGPFAEQPEKAQMDLVKLSVVTNTRLTRLFLKDMIPQKRGKIMFVASLAAFQPAPIMSVYAASKVYLLYLGEALANELKDDGISVTVLCPGMVKTNFQKTTGNTKPRIQWNIKKPEEVAMFGYRSMMKGKVVAIPGFASKLVSELYRIFPRRTATAMTRRIHEANRNK
jgi:short-subunit dehydrogenase